MIVELLHVIFIKARIHSITELKKGERKHVIKVLRDSNYPLRFIQSCKSYHNALRRDSSNDVTSSASVPTTSTFVVLP